MGMQALHVGVWPTGHMGLWASGNEGRSACVWGYFIYLEVYFGNLGVYGRGLGACFWRLLGYFRVPNVYFSGLDVKMYA